MVKQKEAELKQEPIYLHVNVSDRSRIEEKKRFTLWKNSL